MAVLKAAGQGGVLITDSGDRLVDENGNGFLIVEGSFFLKANGKILVMPTSQNNNV